MLGIARAGYANTVGAALEDTGLGGVCYCESEWDADGDRTFVLKVMSPFRWNLNAADEERGETSSFVPMTTDSSFEREARNVRLYWLECLVVVELPLTHPPKWRSG